MSIRESLNCIPKSVSVTVALVLIVVLGIYIVYGQLGVGSSGSFAADEGAKTTLKCTKCGYTFERDTAELQAKYGLPNGRIAIEGEAIKCPKCGRYALEIVYGKKR